MFRENCLILENKKVAPGHDVLRMASARISPRAKPGQFVQILCSDACDPLLPRPFSFLTASKRDFSILYQVVGKGTKLLSQARKGDKLWVVGPLGNGFLRDRRWMLEAMSSPRRRGSILSLAPDKRFSAGGRIRRICGGRGRHCVSIPAGVYPRECGGVNDRLVLVGGGVGIPPLYHLAEHLLKKLIIGKNQIHVFLGARDKSLLLCEKEFKKLGVSLHLATDNGSKGKKGFVTNLLEGFLRTSPNRTPSRGDTLDKLGKKNLTNMFPRDGVRMFTCGPTPMLKTVSMIALKYGIPCEVSVEEPMACGFGACIGCAIKVTSPQDLSSPRRRGSTDSRLRGNDNYRFAMACSEGPVFMADEIVWE